jgi:hypothetical protein
VVVLVVLVVVVVVGVIQVKLQVFVSERGADGSAGPAATETYLPDVLSHVNN